MISFGYFKMMSPQNIIVLPRGRLPGEFFSENRDKRGLGLCVAQSFLLWPRPKSQVSSQPTLKNWLEKFGSNSS